MWRLKVHSRSRKVRTIKNEFYSRIHTNQEFQKSFSNFKYGDIIRVAKHLEEAQARGNIKCNPSDMWFEGVN
jgi:hypothetical protein